ncbi:MAG: acyltransferase [Caulobacteraceae bacterium]|nr:acyltransferase [Caulobacteraceae bacterium]
MEVGSAWDGVDASAPAARAVAPVRAARLSYLDGWRGLSILAVLAGHFAPLGVFNTGRLGVEMFFVLSGRLMAELLFVERVPLSAFLRRRIARVWPALFVFVLIMAVVFHGPGALHVPALDVLAALTFTANYVRIHVHNMGVLDHIWSLCVEEWAYLLLAGVALAVRRGIVGPTLALAALALAGVVQGALLSARGLDYYAVYWRTDVRMASILMAGAVFLVLRGERIAAAWPRWAPVALGLVGVALNAAVVPDVIKYSLGTLCLALAVASLDHAPGAILRALSHPVLARIGLWSFSLYLWQHPFFRLIGRAPEPVLLAGAVLCALVSFYGIEQPARRWLNARWGR